MTRDHAVNSIGQKVWHTERVGYFVTSYSIYQSGRVEIRFRAALEIEHGEK